MMVTPGNTRGISRPRSAAADPAFFRNSGGADRTACRIAHGGAKMACLLHVPPAAPSGGCSGIGGLAGVISARGSCRRLCINVNFPFRTTTELTTQNCSYPSGKGGKPMARVVVVDDEPLICEVIADWLGERRHRAGGLRRTTVWTAGSAIRGYLARSGRH